MIKSNNHDNIQKYAHTIEGLYEDGELNKAVDKINEFKDYLIEQTNYVELIYDYHSIKIEILNARIFEKQGNYHASIKLSHDVLQKSTVSGYNDFKIDSILISANSLWRAGNFDRASQIVNQGEIILSEDDDKIKSSFIEKEARLSNVKGVILRFKGYLDSALISFKKCLQNFYEIENKENISISLNNIV